MSAVTVNSTRNSILPETVMAHLRADERLAMRQAETLVGDLFAAGVAIKSIVRGLANRIAEWRRKQATAAELDLLDDRLLADIGIQRFDIGRVSSGLTMPRDRVADMLTGNFEGTVRSEARRAA